MAEVKIRVGAAVDQSMRTVFKPLMQAATDARKHIQKEFASISAEMKGGFTEGARTAKRALDDTSKAGDAMSRDLERQQTQRARTGERESNREWSAYSRAAKQAFRETEKAAQENQRAINKFADRTSHRATRFFMPNMPIMSMARRAGAEVLQGLGVDASISGSVGRGKDVESLATQLSNQGYRKGEEGPAGTRVESSTLQAEARKVGDDLKLDPAKLLEAQTKFVDITGSLDDSRKNMKGLAEIAAATGTDFTAMAEAAGNISRHLEDGPDKAQKLQAIMRVMAGQGKVGSIEIKDFATQMAKIAALAPKYAGDASANITKLTTLAQLSRAEGGSATAAQAATSVARFTDTFSSGARMKKFNALGVATYEKNIVGGQQVNSKLADPFIIIKQSLEKTKGDALVMADLFKSIMSKRAIDALTAAFNNAGGGKKGSAAVDAQLKVFGKESAITPEEVTEDNAKRMASKAAKAQDFQNKLDVIVDRAVTSLIPALDKLGPEALVVADDLGKLAEWAAGNPWEAVGAAAALAMGRAIVESGVRGVIESTLKSALSRTGINLENANATIGSATLAVGALTLAWEQLEDFKKQNGGWEGVKAFVGAGQDHDFGLSAVNAEMDRQARAKAEEEALKNPKPAGAKSGLSLPSSWDLPADNPGFGAAPPGNSSAIPVAQLTDIKTQLTGVHTAIKDLQAAMKGGIPVTVTNHDQPKAPVAGGHS